MCKLKCIGININTSKTGQNPNHFISTNTVYQHSTHTHADTQTHEWVSSGYLNCDSRHQLCFHIFSHLLSKWSWPMDANGCHFSIRTQLVRHSRCSRAVRQAASIWPNTCKAKRKPVPRSPSPSRSRLVAFANASATLAVQQPLLNAPH